MSIKTINALTLLTPSTVDAENDSVALGDASAGDNARIAFANVAGMIPYAVCDSAAADQAKYISLPGLVISDAVAVEVCVQFTYANTAGTITSGTNVVSDDTAPYFIINNNTTKHYKITVAGENAGRGFNKAGERQKFIIYGGTADSETAANVYSVSNTSSSYSKQRDGKIHKKYFLTISSNLTGWNKSTSYIYIEDGILHTRLETHITAQTISNRQKVFTLSGNLTQLVLNPTRLIIDVDTSSARYTAGLDIGPSGEAAINLQDGIKFDGGSISNTIGFYVDNVATSNPYYPNTSA